MKKLILSLITIVFCINLVHPQTYQLNLPILAGSSFNVENLLAASVTIPDPTPHNFSIVVKVYYSPNNFNYIQVSSMGCAQISLTSNQQIISSPSSIMILQNIVWLDNIFAQNYYNLGSYPAGNYNICYEINELQEVVHLTDCIEWSTIPSLFLCLVSPFDNEIIEDLYPILTWAYTSSNAQNEIKMLRIAAVNGGQSPQQAMISNPPIYYEESEYNILPYPLEAYPLETCKKYAWKVIVINGGFTVAESEIWTFYTQCPDTSLEVQPDFYFPLSRSTSEDSYPVTVALPFFFEHPYEKISDFKVDILTLDNHCIKSDIDIKEKRMNIYNKCYNGTNLYVIKLDRIGVNTPGQYLLRLQNQKETYYLKFSISE